MRWNPFRRAPADEAAESQFESTVVDELGRLNPGPGMLPVAGSPGHGASVPAANDGPPSRPAFVPTELPVPDLPGLAMPVDDAPPTVPNPDAVILPAPEPLPLRAHVHAPLHAAPPAPASPPAAAAPAPAGPVPPAMTPVAAGAMPDSPSIGHIGRYALKTVLGEGGLGTVYAAWDPLLSRTVAVKTLHLDADPAARDSLDHLFLNEARAAAGLSHPHIVTVFDAGPAENGVYIAMERLQGQDLKQLQAQGARPSPLDAAQTVRRVADALAYAHRKGVIHCDIKPANIFMVGRTHPKVLDFGIARVAHRENVPNSLDGVVAGSPYYLAPEQLEGGSVDRRSDVYSLGVVLYELLCGRKPFEGRSIEEIADKVRHADVEPAHRVLPTVPLGLSIIAARAMARKPDQRYPSARHLSMELRHWAESAEARSILDEKATPERRRVRSRSDSSARLWRRRAAVGLPLVAVAGLAAGFWLKALSPAPRVPTIDEAAAASAAVAAAEASPASANPPAAAGSQAAAEAPASAAVAPPVAAPTTAASAAEVRALARAEARKRRQAALAAAGNDGSQVAGGSGLPGVVQLAVSPWGQVEVDGQAMGTSPPLARLTLPAGTHTVTIRNADFPPMVTTISVDAEKPITLRHRFGP